MKKGSVTITAILLFTLVLWVISKNGSLLSQIQTQPLLMLSQICALWSVILIGISFVLASRTKWLAAKLGGMDKVVKLHMYLGGLNFALVFWHPLLLILQALPDRQSALGYLWPSFQPWLYGALAIYGFLLVLLFALYIKIRYPYWKTVHDLLIFPMLLAGLHLLTVTSDVSRSWPLKLWILLWMVGAVIAYIYKRYKLAQWIESK